MSTNALSNSNWAGVENPKHWTDYSSRSQQTSCWVNYISQPIQYLSFLFPTLILPKSKKQPKASQGGYVIHAVSPQPPPPPFPFGTIGKLFKTYWKEPKGRQFPFLLLPLPSHCPELVCLSLRTFNLQYSRELILVESLKYRRVLSDVHG